ncbi:MAG: nicotinamide-nucleotide amidase [Gammaproteobacteria bacterium]
MAVLAERVGRTLEQRGLRLATAESCTGGWIAKTLTDTPGSSAWFERGFVTYSNEAKQDMLGVSGRTLAEHGAVSETTAGEMARGALARSRAEMAVAVTGIAGPEGGSADKPVGTVWLAWAGPGDTLETTRVLLQGDREAVRRQTVELALKGVVDRV